jgi:hypothetical protein
LVLVAANIVSGGGAVSYTYETQLPSDVGDPIASAAGRLSAAPNPLRPGGALHFQTLQDSPVEIELFDPSGRRVWSWSRSQVAAGRHEIPWNGEGVNGRRLSPGHYFARMRAGEVIQTSELVIVQ